MVGSIKMYADNLLCMDLCCWMQEDAINLLGEEVRWSTVFPVGLSFKQHVLTNFNRICLYHGMFF